MRVDERWRTRDQLNNQLIDVNQWPYESVPYNTIQETSRLMRTRGLRQEGLKDQKSKS